MVLGIENNKSKALKKNTRKIWIFRLIYGHFPNWLAIFVCTRRK